MAFGFSFNLRCYFVAALFVSSYSVTVGATVTVDATMKTSKLVEVLKAALPGEQGTRPVLDELIRRGEASDKDALSALGEYYASHYEIPDAPKLAVQYYQKAARAGAKYSFMRLGDIFREGRLVKADYNKAMEYFRDADEAGILVAKVRIGEALIKGEGTNKDVQGGLKLINEVALKGDASAFQTLGNLYSRGPLEVDGPKAIDSYKRAAAGGIGYAFVRLGELYRDGDLVEKDYVKANDYFRKAADAGVSAGRVRLGEALINGLGTPVDFSSGVKLLEQVAAEGDASASQTLGNYYSRGPLPLDPAKAVYYYEEAARLGSVYAWLRLGDLYRDGKLVNEDFGRALSYFRQADGAGVPEAKLRIADAYFKGQGVPLDEGKGLELLGQAASDGNGYALQRLGDFYSRAPQRDGAAAVHYFTLASKSGVNEALIRLGELYRDGIDVPADPDKALDFFKRAVELDVPNARIRLGDAYIRGLGIEADVDRGVHLLEEEGKSNPIYAYKALGDYFSAGDFLKTDSGRAITYYEKSAAAGNPWAYQRLGEIFRDGKIVSKNGVRAAKYFERGAELGLEESKVALSAGILTGQLGRKLDAKDGIEQLTLLSDSGNARATISLAEALYWGHGVAADSVRAIEVLRRGAKLGLRPVTSKLISLYRDAPGGKIKRSLKEARATLDANKQQFSKEEYVREEILLEAAAARNIAGYSKVKEKLSSLSSASRLETLIALRSANPNVFVYVVQFELKKRGLFRGDSNGLLRASTITAMNKLCSKSVSGERCRLGPFSYEAARVISIMLESGLAPTAALE